ncbi:MAG: hypothetical protein SGILL_006049, partial [Bacillariaceae sp.]
MTKDALTIVKKAIQAVDPYTAIRSSLHVTEDGVLHIRQGIGSSNDENDNTQSTSIDLNSYNEMILVAFGKASSAMATATLDMIMSKAEVKNPANDSISNIPSTTG